MRSRYFLQDGDFIAHHYQDAQDIHDRNMRNRADPIRHDWGRPVAEIPDVIALAWFYEESRKDPTLRMFTKRWNDIMARKLRDPEWAYLRCQPEGSPNFSGWRKP